MPDVAQAVAAMRQGKARGPNRRSPVYVWFRDNHDALAAAFALNAPSWPHLANYLGENGLMDGDGKPPKERGARDAWWRVRRDVAAARAKRQGKPDPALVLGEVAPGVNLIPVPALAAGDLADPPARQFKPATLRGHTPSLPPSPAVAPASPPGQVQDPDEVIARLMGTPTRSKFKPRE